jgi:hypothetical protein
MNQQLRKWVDEWANEYPVDYDDVLSELRGRPSFGHEEASVVYKWKFRGLWSKAKIASLNSVADSDIHKVTSEAFASSSELGALRIMSMLPRLGEAGASAMLMAQNPERYTVMDRRTLASLTALGRWHMAQQGSKASARQWLNYLDACRKLAVDAGCELRTLNRALWMANGSQPDVVIDIRETTYQRPLHLSPAQAQGQRPTGS